MSPRNQIIFIALWCVVALLAGAYPGRAQTVAASDNTRAITSLNELRAKALDHPEVKMAEAEVRVAERSISMRSTLMDPMITLGVENLPTSSFAFDQEMMTSKVIGVGQKFPFPGKLSAARTADEQKVVAARHIVDERVNALRRDVTVGYFDLYPLRKGIAANLEHLEDIREIEAIVKTRFESSRATQQDMIRLELRRADLERQIETQRSMLAMKQAEISRVTGQAGIDIITPGTLGLPSLAYSLDELDSMAQANRPLLRSLRAQAERFRLERERIALDRYPDFDVMLMYMQRDALTSSTTTTGHDGTPVTSTMNTPLDDMMSLRVSFNLPLNYGGKQTDAEEEVNAMRTMQEQEFASMRQMIRSMLAARLVELDALRKQYALMQEGTLPLLELSLETALVNYQNFKSDIVTILSAELDLLHRSEEYFQLAANYHKALAEIEYLVGTEILTN